MNGFSGLMVELWGVAGPSSTLRAWTGILTLTFRRCRGDGREFEELASAAMKEGLAAAVDDESPTRSAPSAA